MTTETEHTEFTDLERVLWLDWVERRCGVTFDARRLGILEAAVERRAAQHGSGGRRDYYWSVVQAADGTGEGDELLELVLNRETSFFRNPPAFDALRRHLLPNLCRARADNSPLRLWSAGCSTGQEAYSLAITARETPELADGAAEVLGTDLSRRSLERATAGRYRSFELRGLPEPLRRRYLTSGAGGRAFLVSALRQMVRFEPCNLADPADYPGGGFDVIVCQNVMLYFAPEGRRRCLGELCARLRPGGYLLLDPMDAVPAPPGLAPILVENTLFHHRATGERASQP